jgi:hypothetical protein
MSLVEGFQKNQSLRIVKIGNCPLSQDATSDLVYGLTFLPNLEELFASNTKCGSKALRAIVDILENEQCKLRVLDLLGLRSGAIDILPLATSLTKNKSLAELKIGNNTIAGHGLDSLAQAL